MSKSTPTRPPPKGILKNSSLKRVRQNISDSDVHIDWDENNLRQNEEEKVPRMKISEPKTPYLHDNQELQDPMSDCDLADDFTSHIQVGSPSSSVSSSGMGTRNRRRASISSDISDGGSQAGSGSAGGSSSQDEAAPEYEPELTDADRLRRAKFENVRKAHYNMRAAMVLRRNPMEDDDDDDDVQDNDAGGADGGEDHQRESESEDEDEDGDDEKDIEEYRGVVEAGESEESEPQVRLPVQNRSYPRSTEVGRPSSTQPISVVQPPPSSSSASQNPDTSNATVNYTANGKSLRHYEVD